MTDNKYSVTYKDELIIVWYKDYARLCLTASEAHDLSNRLELLSQALTEAKQIVDLTPSKEKD